MNQGLRGAGDPVCWFLFEGQAMRVVDQEWTQRGRAPSHRTVEIFRCQQALGRSWAEDAGPSEVRVCGWEANQTEPGAACVFYLVGLRNQSLG